MIEFPRLVSFTVTNACTLRCGICGQWSPSGYVRHHTGPTGPSLALDDWKRLVAEVASHSHDVGCVLLRGGEPFLLPGIIDLIATIRGARLPLSIDTAGVCLVEHADAIARIGDMHLTISVDGPPQVHDRARGVPGTFELVERGLRALRAAVDAAGTRISLSLCCTIGPDTYRTLGELPDVARRLGIPVITIVPFCYVPTHVGRLHEAVLERDLGTRAFSWHGFERDGTGVDTVELRHQIGLLRERLGAVEEYPFLVLEPDQYDTWFRDPTAPLGPKDCANLDAVLDVQPNGDATFCTDAPDYSIGNVRDATLAQLWRSDRAERFRAYRRNQAMPACHRCTARYMGE